MNEHPRPFLDAPSSLSVPSWAGDTGIVGMLTGAVNFQGAQLRQSSYLLK